MSLTFDAVRLSVTETDYHNDPCETPSLSSSCAKVIVDQSALHGWHHHPRLGGHRRADKKHFDHGTLIHKMLLGVGREIAIIKANDWRKTSARDEREAARSAGEIPVLEHAHDDALIATASIRKQLSRHGVMLSGESEMQIAWREQVHGEAPIWARAMLDHVEFANGRAVISDIKTTQSAHPKMCMKSVISYAYDVQVAAYRRALTALFPAFGGRIGFRFLFIETEPPYAVAVASLDGMMVARGERRWTKAVGTFSRCLRTNEWPGYGDVTLETPAWIMGENE